VNAKKSSPLCLHCGASFIPNPRLRVPQFYCRKPACAKASHRAAQEKWASKRSNRDHFKGRENVDRVRAWRAAHPHYWRDRRCRERARRAQFCLGKKLYGIARKLALQDSIDSQFSLVVGLVSHLSGHALQDTIAKEIRRLMLLGHGILRQSTAAATSSRPKR
jgi:hypothetical protein